MLHGPRQQPTSGNPAEQCIMLLHGLGADGTDLFGLVPELSEALPNAYFISPHAPFPCDMAPMGYQWFSLQDRSEEAILEGIKKAEPMLNAFIDDQLAELGLEDHQLAIVSFSQGTMLALHTLLRRPLSCGGILGYSGALVHGHMLPVEMESKPPVCLIHGEADDVVPFGAMGAAENYLTQAGVEVETHARPGLSHGIDPEGVAIGKTFLQRIFGIE